MARFQTLTEIIQTLRRGDVTSEALTQRTLERIETLNPHLGAFTHVGVDVALEQARAADRRLRDLGGDYAEHQTLPPLLGVPTAVKDSHDVAGMPTSWGSLTTQDDSGEVPVASANDALTSVLGAAGAVVVGKTQIPEFMLNNYSESRAHPPARNPFALDCSPGGSSGGQAAAVAAGILPGVIGSDGGGSVRIPAAACGLIGLKPNRGRVPSRDALDDVYQLGVYGPIARTAADAALLMDVLCATPGHTTLSRPLTAVPQEHSYAETVSAALRGTLPWGERPLRIGVSTVSPFDSAVDVSISPEARVALEQGIAQLRQLGHDVVETNITYDPIYPKAFFSLWSTVMGQIPLEGQEHNLTGLARSFRAKAGSRSAVELADAVAALRRFEASVISQYSAYDMILTPALALPPRPVGWAYEGYSIADPAGAQQDYQRQCEYSPWSSHVNVVGLPAITMPTAWLQPANGSYPNPVPMGIQLIGAPSSEAWLLALAAQMAPPTTPRASLVA